VQVVVTAVPRALAVAAVAQAITLMVAMVVSSRIVPAALDAVVVLVILLPPNVRLAVHLHLHLPAL
jgi:hypothetical protein